MTVKIIHAISFLLLPVIFFSCSNAIGYGVLLWGEKGSDYKTGEIVTLLAEAGAGKEYFVPDKKSDKRIIMPAWRLEYFKDYGKCEEFAGNFKTFTNLYAYSEKDGVPPVREAPDTNAQVNIIFKLKKDQVVKIIGREKDKVDISGMEDYWYRVLVGYQKSELGEHGLLIGKKGYCFGYYLKLFEAEGDPEERLASLGGSTLSFIDYFFSKTWRPIVFKEMMDSGRIDLSKFRESMGIFPQKEDKTVKLVTDKISVTYSYTQPTEVKPGVYILEGTPLRIERNTHNRISLKYLLNDTAITQQFIVFDKDIGEITNRELERRDRIFEDFYSKGNRLSSSAYGQIRLRSDKTVTWSGFDKLVPNVLPENFSGTGRFDFPFYLASNLKSGYDGVITLSMDNLPKNLRTINFLYKFTNNGVRFYSLLSGSVENMEVKKEAVNAIVIFFEFTGD
ncbi:MAG: SH3 domain-containing protein [Spirochaetales bacterium]|nr:SH3 domain-containing protein [Spirochaetales bacterium]